MKLHRIKLDNKYIESVYMGHKSYEVRFNDRDYKVGDIIRFIDDKGEPLKSSMCPELPFYRIVHRLKSVEGLEEGYVVLGIDEIKESKSQT